MSAALESEGHVALEVMIRRQTQLTLKIVFKARCVSA